MLFVVYLLPPGFQNEFITMISQICTSEWPNVDICICLLFLRLTLVLSVCFIDVLSKILNIVSNKSHNTNKVHLKLTGNYYTFY